MDIISVAETTSTFDLAQQQLSARMGANGLPYAIIAARQSAGVGQHGRSWESPVSNVYLTLVCAPPTYELPMAVVCTTIVCEWLSEFGYNPTCKWANDILVQGKKLAGILCKGAMQGGKWQHLLIGIGLNVNCAPLANSICMQDIDGIARSTHQLAVALAKYLANALQNKLLPQKHYTCAGAELWYDDEHNYYLRHSADANYLCLTPLQDNQSLQQDNQQLLRLTDSRGYHYAYQQPIDIPTLVADVGNTSTKLTLFPANNASEPMTFHAHDLTQLHTALQKLQTLIAKHWVIYCVSVNADGYANLQLAAKSHGFVLSLLDGCFRYTGDYDYQQLGADRLAMLEACLNDYHHGKRTLVASFGTATTLDVLSASGKHEGGLIVAGADSSLQALYQSTQLPRSPKQQALDVLGTDTASCIYNGQLQCQLALLERTQQQHRAEQVVISGGYASVLAPAMPQAIYDPILVAKGIKAMLWRI